MTSRGLHFGMPTLIECPELDDSINLCKELGLQFVELNMNLPQYQTDRIDTSKAKALLSGNDIYCTIHLDEKMNVCDFNTDVASAYLNTVCRTIITAKSLEIPVLNMHMSDGVYFTLPDRRIYLFEQYKDMYLSTIERFRDTCSHVIGSDNVVICIENTGIYHDFQKAGIDLLLQSPKFKLTYDIGHSYSQGFTDEAFTMERQDKLCHMHIHDGLGGRNHLPLGTGEIDVLKYIDLAVKNNCRCVLETKTIKGLKQSVSWINNS